MTTRVTYVPEAPSLVKSVDRLRGFLTPSRLGMPVLDVGPAVANTDGSWTFTFEETADGLYFSVVTTTYFGGEVVVDQGDVFQPSPSVPTVPEGPSEAWVAATDLDRPEDPNSILAAQAASATLYALSGRKFPGIVRTTEVYTLTDWACGAATSYLSRTESAVGARLRPFARSWSGRPDPRYRYDYIRLKRRPARQIIGVRFGPDFTSLVDPSEYGLLDSGVLEFYTGVRQEVRVTYRYGTNPPASGKLAALVLANELLKAYNGEDGCRLPDRVTSVSRQGISYTIMDAQDFLEKGRTGIYEIDLFLKAVNPQGALKKSRVFNPDLPRARRIG